MSGEDLNSYNEDDIIDDQGRRGRKAAPKGANLSFDALESVWREWTNSSPTDRFYPMETYMEGSEYPRRSQSALSGYLKPGGALLTRALSVSPQPGRRRQHGARRVRESDFLPDSHVIEMNDVKRSMPHGSQRSASSSNRFLRALSASPAAMRRRLNYFSSGPATKRSIKRGMSFLQEEKAMASTPQYPIEMHKFAAYVQERRKKRILFKGEYLMIKRSVEEHATEFATRKENVEKNQYPETLPFDYNRVILKPLPNIPDSHYINASFVDSFYRPKAYIVTQACKTKDACTNFWRMVWEYEVNCVVMLTKVFDFMRVMCIQYFPMTRCAYGEIDVETVEAKSYSNFVVRRIKLTKKTGANEGAVRFVQHFHFTEWELSGYPYISALLEFRRRVKQFVDHNPCKGPLVIHCSDGGPRSGIYIAVDANMDLGQEENILDVYGYAKTLINSRQNLIGDMDHYTFIYDVLLEAVTCSITAFSIHDLQMRITTLMTKKDRETLENQYGREFKLLSTLTPALSIGDCAGGHRLENRGKNRDVMVVPPDYARPYLSTLHGESKDYTYINAVYADGFTRKNEWIITEWPKSHTLDSFWALIFDHNCHTVVMLTNQPSTKHFPPIVQTKGKQVYGPFVVEVTNYRQYAALSTTEVRIYKRPWLCASLTAGTSLFERSIDPGAKTFMMTEVTGTGGGTTQDQEVQVCSIFSVRMWPMDHRVPLSTSGYIDLIKMARSWRRRAPDRPETKPTVVLSHNGVSRVGVFVAANIVIDQMESDKEVDVFHAVKLVRMNRPELVDNKEEYKYIYDLILHYSISSPELAQGKHITDGEVLK